MHSFIQTAEPDRRQYVRLFGLGRKGRDQRELELEAPLSLPAS